MEYFVKSGNPEKQRVGCVVVGIFDRRKPTEAAAVLDTVSEGAIGSALRRGDMDGKAGSTLVLHNLPNMFGDRVLLVGLGRERDFNEAAYRKALGGQVDVQDVHAGGSRRGAHALRRAARIRGRRGASG